jgi:CHAD domain-containing protein
VWLTQKKRRWIKKRLKKIRRAAGDARDLDVLADRVRHDLGDKAGPVLELVRDLRESAQPAIINVAEKCRRNDRFAQKTGKLIEEIRPPRPQSDAQTPESFRAWAAQQLTHAADEFFRVVPADGADAQALHQFRIQTKALRYAIELLAPAFGPDLREVTYPVVEELQERLGAIQDCVVGAKNSRSWVRDADSDEVCELLNQLAEIQDARRQQLTAEFQNWWTPERVAMLKSGLLFTGQDVRQTTPPVEKDTATAGEPAERALPAS